MKKMLLTLNFKVTTFTIGKQQVSCFEIENKCSLTVQII
jgi:hypothetical protein